MVATRLAMLMMLPRDVRRNGSAARQPTNTLVTFSRISASNSSTVKSSMGL